MKLFAALIDYPANVLERRAPHRAAHLAYLTDLIAHRRALMGGAFADPTEGAIIVYRAASAEEVRRMMDEDPYGKAGLFDRVTIREWNVVVGHPDAV